MSIPDFQSVMLPLLQLLGDGEEQTTARAIERLSDQFALSDAERKETIASGRQGLFANRVHWAFTHLSKARLIDRTGRGRVRIADRGREILTETPARVDMRRLASYPEYVAFQRGASRPDRSEQTVLPREQTPEETLEASYRSLRSLLAAELLDRIGCCPPSFFERLVVDLLVAMGYGGSRADAGQAVGRTGDDGIDGIIKEDKLGLDVVYIQAKRRTGTVGRPEVQAFAGSLEGQRARKGVFLTTSRFTADARDYVTRIEKRIVLIDGQELGELLIDHGIGVADVETYRIKRIDADYFDEEQA